MMLKFKDSRNNWKYIQLGDFTVNKLSIGNDIETILKPFTLEQIADYGSENTRTILSLIGKCIADKTDISTNKPIIDWNVIHKLNNVIVVENNTSSLDMYCKKDYFENYQISQSSNQAVYVISNECYLMDGQGNAIEKLM